MDKLDRIIVVLKKKSLLTFEEIAQETSHTVEQVKHFTDNFHRHGQFQAVIRDDCELAFKINNTPTNTLFFLTLPT